MADNPFSTPKPPKPDERVAESAERQAKVAEEMLQMGREQLQFGRQVGAQTTEMARPIYDTAMQGAPQLADMGQQQLASYDAVYQPVEQLSLLNSLGAGWLSDEEYDRLLGEVYGAQNASLRDMYVEDRDYLKDQQKSAAQPAASTSTRTVMTPAGIRQIPTQQRPTSTLAVPTTSMDWRYNPQNNPGILPAGGLNAPHLRYGDTSGAQNFQNTQARVGSGATIGGATGVPGTQSERAYYTGELADQRADRTRDIAGQNRDLELARTLNDVSRGAEAAAERMAQADVYQAEARNRQATMRDALRYGVDPSQALTAQSYQSPALAAQAANAGNQARFGIRNQTTAGLNQQANFGRGVLGSGQSLYSGATNLGTQGLNAYLAGVSPALNATASAAPIFNSATQGFGAAGGLYNQNYANQVNAYANTPNSGFADIVGTGLGIWAGRRF